MRKRNPSILAVVSIILFSGCGEKIPSMSDKDRAEAEEAVRQISASVESTAASLVVINPKHDKQYFIDRQTQAIKACAKAADVSSCLRPKLEALKYE